MRVGAQVRAGPTLLGALERAGEIGAEVVQVFTQSPRMWRPSRYDDEVLAGYRRATAAWPGGMPTFCHATYLINLATPDPALLDRSRRALDANLATARAIHAAGLVLHVGSHLGAGLDRCLRQLGEALVEALDAPLGAGAARCPILLENTAGGGGTVGRSLDELEAIVAAAGGHGALGLCLDTQHLFAAGIPYGTPEEVEALLRAVDGALGLERLGCLHVNESRVPFGSGRDRHANPGEGLIGDRSLGWLLGHPSLAEVPAVLEVAGAGHGPRADDLAAVRRLVRSGAARWRRRAGLAPAASPPHAGGRDRPAARRTR
jgi:deoxyribonuclease-4